MRVRQALCSNGQSLIFIPPAYPIRRHYTLARLPAAWYIPLVFGESFSPKNNGEHIFHRSILKATTRINQSIRALELRVIGADGANLGVIARDEALKAAQAAGLDLIEISPNAQPPVAKIMDFGKFQYLEQKKAREVKAKSHVTETKSLQVKIGTGEHDLGLKAKRAAEWLTEGHRVKVDLFLWGRYKYMEEGFLKERLERFLKLIPADYKIAEAIKRSPKGFSTTLEKAGTK